MKEGSQQTNALPAGVGAAIMAAALFGVSTPCAKLLLGTIPPVLLAGLVYLGSGVGLSIVWLARRRQPTEAPLERKDLPWLAPSSLAGCWVPCY